MFFTTSTFLTGLTVSFTKFGLCISCLILLTIKLTSYSGGFFCFRIKIANIDDIIVSIKKYVEDIIPNNFQYENVVGSKEET